MSTSPSLRKNFIMNFILSATNFIFPLITFPYISRVLGTEGTGTVSFVTSVISYFTVVANLGIPTYGIRACARVRDNKVELSKTVHELFIINSVTTLASLVLLGVSICFVPQFREEKTLFYINGIGLLLNLFGINWLYQALEEYSYITTRSIIAKLVSICLMFVFVRQDMDYVMYGAISVIAAVGANIFNFIRARHIVILRRLSGYRFGVHIKPIMVLFAQTIVSSIYLNLDVVMLGFMKGNSDVGLYNAAIRVRTILVSLVSSLGVVLLPRMSKLVGDKDSTQLNFLTKTALDSTMFLAVPLSIYFSLFAQDCILLLAGEEFVGAVQAMQFITVAVIPIGFTGILGGQVLTAMGRERYVLYSVVVGAFVDLMLNILLISSYGATGAAFATMIAEFVVLVVQMYYARFILKPIVRKLRIGYYFLSALVSAILSLLVMNVINLNNLVVSLSVSAATYFLTYAGGLLICKDPVMLQCIDMLKLFKKN